MSKLTAKQKHFAELVAVGDKNSDGKSMSLTAAYRASYSADKMSKASIRVEGSRLCADPKITLLIEKLRAEKDRCNTAALLSDRDRSLEKIRSIMDGGDTAAVQLQAAVWLGKSAGVFADTKPVNDKPMTSAEIRAEIKQRLDELSGKPSVH